MDIRDFQTINYVYTVKKEAKYWGDNQSVLGTWIKIVFIGNQGIGNIRINL